jgi:hypothetical protein
MNEYTLVESFCIDNHELDDIKSEDAFVLGVEWEMFRQRLTSDQGEFSVSVHNQNVARFKSMSNKRGRAFWYEVVSEHWCKASVGASVVS